MGVCVLLSIIVIASVICITSALDLWEIIDLKAVTFTSDTAEYYRTIRRQQKSGDPPIEVANRKRRADIKKKICRNVFTSHHFQMIGRDWIDIDDTKIQRELLDNLQYREIVEFIFIMEISIDDDDDDYEYENAYQRRLYDLGDAQGGAGDDYVFMCPVRNRSTREIQPYFVTQEYNVNSSPSGQPIAGRFIFESDGNLRLKIRAMAEESALKYTMSRVSSLVEMKYLRTRLYDPPTSSPSRDPVCRLSDQNRVRLCASLFSTSDFKGKVTFLPTADYLYRVRGRCEYMEVSVTSYSFLFFTFMLGFIRPSEAIALPFEQFRELIIGCYASTSTGAQMLYYISKGDDINTIYVYVQDEDDPEELTLYNHYYNVSVVGEMNRDEVATDDNHRERSVLNPEERSENEGTQREPYGNLEDEEDQNSG